jgi:hypothetical protein
MLKQVRSNRVKGRATRREEYVEEFEKAFG